jgi:hypothetical protein
VPDRSERTSGKLAQKGLGEFPGIDPEADGHSLQIGRHSLLGLESE